MTDATPDIHPALRALGWDEQWVRAFEEHAAAGREPARVAIRHKDQYVLVAADGERKARIKGHLRYNAMEWGELPLVGDWVAIARREREDFWRIHACLPRRTEIARKVKGTGIGSQVLAANVDHVFIVMGLTEDFNPRRLERYLVIVHESGARPVVLLNKADLLAPEELDALVAETRAVAGDSPVHAVSAIRGDGVPAVHALMGPGVTVMLTGSSGAGKSTLVNALFGEERMSVGEVRESDGRGRHTTTQREMLFLPGGGILVDSPGLREIQLLPADDGIAGTFDDIAELAGGCRFRDCSHDAEPGCAVRAAIESDELELSRFESWKRLQDEGEAGRARRLREGERRHKAFRDLQARRRVQGR